MALIFIDGMDKYGGLNNNSPIINALLAAGEWTSAVGSANLIAAGLSATGFALTAGNSGSFIKTLPANYARLIGGFRFSGTLVGQSSVLFRDGATSQCTLSLETTGAINLRTGSNTGTILQSGGTVSASSIHYVEFDITFGAAASYQVWLDGVSLFNGTGNTRGGATNNYANTIVVGQAAVGAFTIDDFYLFDATGTVNNAVLLNSPRIETTFPTSDSAIQFAFGSGILGSSVARSASLTGIAVNRLTLRRFVPAVNCTINSIGGLPQSTVGGANLRGVIYADSAGVAGALMSSGTTITGAVAGTAITLPLTTPQNLTAGTPYWIGLMNDTQFTSWANSDNNNLSYAANVTFTSGAPGTAPALANSVSYVIWGNLTGIAANNWVQSAQQPSSGQYSYVYDANVNDEDLYNFASLTTTPASIHAVAVKGYVAKSDSGTRTVSLRLKSGSTDSGGSLIGQAPGTTFGWLRSHFETDPATGVAWTLPALNAATSGVKIDS